MIQITQIHPNSTSLPKLLKSSYVLPKSTFNIIKHCAWNVYIEKYSQNKLNKIIWCLWMLYLGRAKRIRYLSPMRASAQSRQNLRCLLIQALSQEEPSDRKPDPWPLSMAGHAQLKFVMMECSKTQIRLTRPIYRLIIDARTKMDESCLKELLLSPAGMTMFQI